MRGRTTVIVTALTALTVLTLAGCGGGGAAGADLPEDPSLFTPDYTTPSSTDVGFRVTAETGQYEVRLRIFLEPDYDPDTGVLSVTSSVGTDPVPRNGWITEEQGIDPIECDFQHNKDLAIAVQVLIVNTGDQPLPETWADLPVDYDAVMGFPNGDRWSHHTAALGQMSQGDCDYLMRAPDDYYQLRLDARTAGLGVGVNPSPASMRTAFILIRGAGSWDDAARLKFLSQVAITMDLTAPSGAENVKVEYTDPDQTRLLIDNGCLSVHQPLTLDVTNPVWVTPADSLCDDIVFASGSD